ncbi:MAG: 16S rRNA (adenine(1518)-N(6)/adenine(1519)-N(6))-dimethyltransferase RsmA [Eubacterium sp.]|nr:16S rRNA (adenine(1518)-N(6)/adenine(1519)-N(6))-dimethyltransferase RsmA [Eubacterium sp.]
MTDNAKKLSNPQVTIQTIQKYGFRFQKRFGQNFLIDGHVIEKILRAADISKDDIVVEIGPGIGTLTQYLAEAAGTVYAVEIDDKLLPILADTLSDYDNVEVINRDILKCDIAALIRGEYSTERPDENDTDCAERSNDASHALSCKIVANLPYYITTPIIMSLLEGQVPAQSITVMVQKEVADRMAAAPGSKNYGALSLAVQYYADTYLAANVPPNCFMPRPAVGSAVIRLTRLEKPPVEVSDPAWMFRIIRASFNERRKTLVNGLRNDPGLGISKEQAEAALLKMGLPVTVRGETLSLAQFAELADILCVN